MNTTYRFRRSGLGAIGSAISAVTGYIARQSRVRRERAELYALSDSMLRDIGLTRSELVSIAMHGGNDRSRRAR
jgi:uncharacterized protein YjiS (DUF1127 family)